MILFVKKQACQPILKQEPKKVILQITYPFMTIIIQKQ
ncbi:hypothetical protein B425_4084 [Bacillus amyloliquefaciens]|nr:hypothetical protein LL3_04218 [Bacillus amyloliquefaciens LL3]KYC92430.1 hypothetical protein B425_4084 [Bacillus amyloliquefaciens]